MSVEYPIALDNDYAIWRAFSNRVLAGGLHRRRTTDESGITNSARADTRSANGSSSCCCAKAGAGRIADDLVAVVPDGFEAQADWSNLRSPETYLGYAQTQNFASPGGAELDEPRTYLAPDSLQLNEWALSGEWTSRVARAC